MEHGSSELEGQGPAEARGKEPKGGKCGLDLSGVHIIYYAKMNKEFTDAIVQIRIDKNCDWVTSKLL